MTLAINLPLSDEELITSLRHFPSLRYLSIAELFTNEVDTILESDKLVKTVTKSLIKKLTVVDSKSSELLNGSGPSPFLPGLRYLRLLVHAHFDANEEFVEMCTLFALPLGVDGTRIQDRDAEKSVYEPLKVYDSEGMKIVVKANEAYIIFIPTS
ncbi:hypothetical protein PQX77_016654 [Marasmius sp. AFHP31]|nr:hypothetical protein PQX77_016654 [Marasmius sp. AFHP31]